MKMINEGRIFGNVEVRGDCLLYRGALTSDGYARVKMKGRKYPLHRLSYEHVIGRIPKAMQIDHVCRRRECVNPGHLEPVTPQENVLRGNTLAAKNAKKTRCANGHLYNRRNTNDDRECSSCKKAYGRKYYHQNAKRINARRRGERRENPEKVKAYYRDYRRKNARRLRAYFQKYSKTYVRRR